MAKTLLIIVSGPPSSGKTSIAKKVAKEFHLPLVFKDGIKEMLFNTLGWYDKEWTEKLNSATFETLYYFIASQLEADLSFVVEADFKPDEHTKRFEELKQKYRFEPFQIFCNADKEVLLERYKERAESGDRHPGHRDKENLPDLEKALREEHYETLPIGGKSIEVDTTYIEKINYDSLLDTIRDFINS
jgi:adenylate kinase family enzyme